VLKSWCSCFEQTDFLYLELGSVLRAPGFRNTLQNSETRKAMCKETSRAKIVIIMDFLIFLAFLSVLKFSAEQNG